MVLNIQEAAPAWFFFFPAACLLHHGTMQPPVTLCLLKRHCIPPHASVLSWKNTHKEDLFFQSARYLLQTSAKHRPVFLPRKGEKRGSELCRFRYNGSVCWGAEQFHLCQLIQQWDFNSCGSWLFRFQKIKGKKKRKRKQPIKITSKHPKNNLC